MPRTRSIRPEHFSDEKLAALPWQCRILLPALWCLADRDGRLEDRPQRIKAFVFPYEECDMEACLETLYLSGYIKRYSFDGMPYIEIVNWKRDQTQINIKEVSSRLPSPIKPGAKLKPHVLENEVDLDKPIASIVQAQSEHGASTPIKVVKDVDVKVLTSTPTPTTSKTEKSSTSLTKSKKTDELSPSVARLQKFFDERLEGKFGPHSFPWAVAGLKFRTLLGKKIPEDEIMKRIDHYFASTEKFIEDNGYSITIFADHKFNALAGGPIGRNGNYAGHAGSDPTPGYAAPVAGKYAALTQRGDKGP